LIVANADVGALAATATRAASKMRLVRLNMMFSFGLLVWLYR
jgi:hypothetical protein